ncbi:toxin-antitoxin system, antitoxin component, Xre family protein [Fructilactobacillus sanfranciscensis]|uniref:helix-turn-helix domain-containing protein n=1 Tax=Fructilactobacillus TaxID=2767881 RepID=UPI00081A9B65|nr:MULTISPECIES: helix-turn-helix transcriptional regulator [Fructilactobacillus]ANZ58414.1 toxin-antitoxin system, antitoxin component, Xre family protein [Fructilactobacillus lindneri]MCG7194745.1 XRE family transcriptional regulator [Fructilactobacillus sanfranciscensis]MDN4462412.1 helix-turn-helix transcriptional regulator [Fructilactobacillus sanfranciscensis]NDR61396.1 XRE family transcriptional regulator [Fructilactobacillus sanfranciscensis]POG98482.1 toxin-antitoxin system, antitoxin
MKNNFSTLIGAKLLNINEVSRATGISRGTLSNIYNKKNQNIQMKTLLKLCDYLNVPLHELIDYQPK